METSGRVESGSRLELKLLISLVCLSAALCSVDLVLGDCAGKTLTKPNALMLFAVVLLPVPGDAVYRA